MMDSASSNVSTTGLNSELKAQSSVPEVETGSVGIEPNSSNQNLKLLAGFSLAAVVLATVTYLGLDYFFTRSTAQTYQECVAEGGKILESFPEQCLTADGRSFTAPLADDAEPTSQLSVREQEQLAAAAQGNQIFYQDDITVKVTVPDTWSGLVYRESTISATVTGDFYPALRVQSPEFDPEAAFNEITFSLFVPKNGPFIGDGQYVAAGLAGIETSRPVTSIQPAVFQVQEFQATQFLGLPAVVLTQQFSTQAPALLEEGVCPGCWQRRYFVEHPEGYFEVKYFWPDTNQSFESTAEQILQNQVELL